MSSPATSPVPFQVASLVNTPSYPNSVAWSDDNLIAVATGDIVTILNPENVQGPRGVINIAAGRIFPIGVIDRADLTSGCLLPTCLARDRQPCVRSLSWSPVGCTPGNGCLLAVCSTEGHVKLYREPLCEFQAEWIEVMDISDLLQKYLAKTNYGEPEISAAAVMDDSDSDSAADDISKFTSTKKNKRKRDDDGDDDFQIVLPSQSKKTSNKRKLNRHTGNVLKAHQYASRSSMLASLDVAWSPVLHYPDNPSGSFCLLAVGSKSGSISIWSFERPSYYSVEHNDDLRMTLVGVFHTHCAWVTALSWGLLASDLSPRVLLASGYSDGSAKIWQAHVCDFKRLFEPNQTPLSLFSEIAVADNALVSTLSLCIPAQSPQKILVAVGRGSGSFEVWTINRKTKSVMKVGSSDAHVHAVTGLAWAFDGHYLYSCGQDNSLHVWIHHKASLLKASIPPSNLGIRSFSDLPSVSDSSYGVAVSPSNLALAVARRFDAGQLDQMYQKRTQRAAVEFFWIGGQEFNMSQRFNLTLDIDPYPGFAKEELLSWGSNLLWSLNQYESCDKHLVAWDVLVAVLDFKQRAPEIIKHLILRWIELSFESDLDSSTNNIWSDLPRYMSQISSRKLNLLNILCRRVMVFSGDKDSKISIKLPHLAASYDMDVEKWLNVLSNSEKELRERLVGLSLSTVLSRLSHPALEVEFGFWNPIGIGQMVEWVMQNQDHLHHKLKLLATEVRGHAARLQNVSGYMAEELCFYCSAPVPFESPEVAHCEGVQCDAGVPPQKHKLVRCAVSMQVCPLKPLWFCICCKRRCSNLPPNHLHNMVDRPSDVMSYIKSVVNPFPNPLCPFCGVSLQRLQPDFLLSKSPV